MMILHPKSVQRCDDLSIEDGVKHLVNVSLNEGLDREAAKRVFADFFDGRTLTADQLEFLDLVIAHLMARGFMDPKLLYESPFTDFDSNGVEGVFDPADVVQLVEVLRELETRSAA